MKKYRILLIILVVYFVVFFCVVGIGNLKRNGHQVTLLIGDNTVWNYNKQKWENITSDTIIDKLGWQEYNVYVNNKYVDDYYMWYDDSKWYAFTQDKDKNKKAVILEGDILAYRSNYDLKVKSFKTETNKNKTYVNQVLTENSISTGTTFTTNNVVKIDIDNDGVIEEFYTISNAFATDNYPTKVFSIVFMVKNGQIYPMYKNITTSEKGSNCKPFIRTVFDIDDDDTHEVLVTCAKYSVQKPEDMLYQLTDEGFKLVISNQ